MITSNRFKKTALLLGDIGILYGSLFATLSLRYGIFSEKNIQELWDAHKWPFLFVNLLWVLVFYIAGFYDIEKFASTAKITYVLKTMAVGGGLAVLLFYSVPSFVITPKTNLLIDAAFASVLVWGWRKIFQKIIVKSSRIKIFFLGAFKEISDLTNFIEQRPQLGYQIVSDISASNIIVTSEETKKDQHFMKILYDLILSGKTAISFYKFYESVTGKVPVSEINQAWFLDNMTEVDKQNFEKIKRFADILMAAILSLIFAAILPFVALAIKINSRGPIFYKQQRVGKNGKIFEIIKFRSMIALNKDGSAETNGAAWSQKNDKRITLIGNILRKTRIDELPQIWNVLKGELSFVGPRPERPQFVKELNEKIPYYSMRQLVKPGLSGWAQINFPYGASVADATQKLQYDLYYVKNRNIFLELGIILKTIMTIIRKEGR